MQRIEPASRFAARVAPTIETVAVALDRHGLRRVVLDPVLVTTSDAAPIDPAAVAALAHRLFWHVCGSTRR